MLIDDFINSKQEDIQSGGSNKKCFVFDEYVLLYGSFREEELKREMAISNDLKKRGVALIPTLEYKIVTPVRENGFVKGYMLQARAKGDWLYSRNMKDKEYKKRLKQIANMNDDKLNKFISDWLAIVDAGLQVDPSKTENFFYSDEGIGFIDLNLRQGQQSLKTTFFEVVSVLTGLRLIFKTTTASEDCIKIVKNVARSFLLKGLDINQIKEVLSSHSYLLGNFINEQQIDYIIESLNKEQKYKQATSDTKEKTGKLILNIKRLKEEHSI